MQRHKSNWIQYIIKELIDWLINLSVSANTNLKANVQCLFGFWLNWTYLAQTHTSLWITISPKYYTVCKILKKNKKNSSETKNSYTCKWKKHMNQLQTIWPKQHTHKIKESNESNWCLLISHATLANEQTFTFLALKIGDHIHGS